MGDATSSLTVTGSFLDVMKANRAGVLTTLSGGILIFVIWQLALVFVTLSSPLVQSLIVAGEVESSAQHEATGVILFLLAGFGPAFVVTLLWRKLMERQDIATLFTGFPRFRWTLALASAAVVGALGLGLTLAFDSESVSQIGSRLARFSGLDWLMLSLAYGLGIGIQATFEEVFLRGWLLQHVRRFVPSALGAIVATAIIFSALHYGHPGWATYVAALIFGLAYGWSALRLNGLEAAMGAHIANNLIAALLTGQMVTGNAPSMDLAQFALYGLYVLGFLFFVELWARFGANPSRL
jgi:membrane protease YdiL (CAAX protease family)